MSPYPPPYLDAVAGVTPATTVARCDCAVGLVGFDAVVVDVLAKERLRFDVVSCAKPPDAIRRRWRGRGTEVSDAFGLLWVSVHN